MQALAEDMAKLHLWMLLLVETLVAKLLELKNWATFG